MKNIDDREAQLRIRDLLLNALTVSSGAVDAVSFLALSKVFTAFMTGNVVFFGLRIAGGNIVPDAMSILIPIITFAIGVYISMLIIRPTMGSGIWPPRVTIALAMSLIPHATFLAVWFGNNSQPTHQTTDLLLGMWGLAMGIQSAAVRTLHVEGVFTTAATATIIVLLSDIACWTGTETERQRLARVLVSLFIGATAGGLLLVYARIFAPLLPFVITFATVSSAHTLFRQPRVAQ